MTHSYGFILLDSKEVIASVYAYHKSSWKLIHTDTHDLTSFDQNEETKVFDFVEIIANILFKEYPHHVTSWKIFARNIPEQIVTSIAHTTNHHIELLTLVREQDLLCRGLLTEVAY